MKHVFSIVVLTLMFCSVFAITWEDTPNPIGNAAVSFAGEPATQAVGDTIYIAYLSRADDNYSLLNFTKSSHGDTHSSVVLGYVDFFISSDPGAPSLVVDLPKITILVKGIDYMYQCISENCGSTWTSNVLAASLINSNDPYPLMSLTDAGIRNFTVKSQDNAVYESFTNKHKSMNDTNIYYSSYDVIEGPVLINSDMYIKQIGGGNNGGWPTFLGPVTISGQVLSTPSNFPVDQVFQGGLIENADPALFRPNLTLFKQDFMAQAESLGPLDNDDYILLLEVEANSYSGWLGTLSVPRRVYADVYDPYPSLGGTLLYRNSFTVRDTIWTPISGGLLPEKLHVKGTLWLKGTFSGQRSIYCDSDIYLIGDILLSGTPVGSSPLDPYNAADKVTLISDKQIIIKYGYKNPADSLRIHPNLGSDSDYMEPFGGGIFIYADLIALHKDAANARRSGMFSFEYQHPHPSVPAVNMDIAGESHYFDNIDLHRRHYPQTAINPWPSQIDYPWYNPLWPEAAPYLERGTMNLWGSLYQERAGFMHRSYSDGEYPSGIWDIDLDKCGGPVSPNPLTDPVFGLQLGLQPRNYPGAAGAGVGYKRAHRYDPRSFDNMPSNDVWGLGALISESVSFDNPGSVVKWHKLNEPVIYKSMDYYGGEFLYHLNNTLFTDEAAYPQDLPDDWEIVQAKLLPNDHLITLQREDNEGGQSHALLISNLEHSSTNVIHQTPYTHAPDYISLHRILDGFLYVIPGANGNAATLIRLDENGNFLSNTDTLPLPADFASDSLSDSRIVLSNPEPGILHAVLWAKTSPLGTAFWHLQGSIAPISTDDPVIVPAALSISCYPNPFTDTISLKVKSPVNQHVKIDIYNVKGQKVKSLQLYANSGFGQVTWNGNDEKGQSVAQGVYFARIADAETTKITKILRIK